jgi:ATP-dependent helicase/nuclease subunit A
MVEPNKQQKKLINNIDGIKLVDAGAGTGKTFTITRRYRKILESGSDPEDIFLVTFTNNAADQMKERIAQKVDESISSIMDAPISTFHSHCQKILKQSGFNAPEILGFDSQIPEQYTVMESSIREGQEFDRFIKQFRSRHPEHQDFFRIAYDESDYLNLLRNLSAKGVIPTKDGWFGDSRKHLEGDKEKFKELFKEANKPVESGNGGQKQSELRRRLYSYKWKDFTEDAPEIDDLRGGYGSKQVSSAYADRAFEEDREELIKFIHDIYTEYIEYCLNRNYLNFSFILMFAYVLLHSSKEVREKQSFDYLMIDEFQDTNEIQFKLALLLADKPNVMVVGDWKQSIYSFQYANVDNILEFEDKLESYREELNKEEEKVEFPVTEVEQHSLIQNYRSTQKILDTAEKTLSVKANRHENPGQPDITSLESAVDQGEGEVKKIESPHEIETVLAEVQKVVDNPDYTIATEEGERHLKYSDIAVLTRNRSFGLDLQNKAEEHSIPASYEGGIEIFNTKQGKLLLAWLRLLNNRKSRKGWVPLLEHTGYNLDEARGILEEEEYPSNILEFREKLENKKTIQGVVASVFQRYGLVDSVSAKIIEIIDTTFNNSYISRSELISFIEQNIEEGETYQTDNTSTDNAVTVQTIHAAKGLEYPVVFVSNINQDRFPSTSSSSSAVQFEETTGIRMRKNYISEDGLVYDSWKTEIMNKTLPQNYDEERRLFYVASTRAEKYLYMTAESGNMSTFFSEIDADKEYQDSQPEEDSGQKSPHPVFRID